MLNWLRRKWSSSERPAISAANPGIGVSARVAFSNGERTWTEEINIVEAAARILKKHGHAVESHDTWLEQRDSGLVLQPQLVGVQPMDNGGVRTVTTVEASHPQFVPTGLFEYQHAAADTLENSVVQGFDQWAQLDLVPLLDALRPKPASCTQMVLSLPEKDGRPPRNRRAVLGPVAHLMTNPPSPKAPAGGESCDADAPDDAHPFCPCCLLTNSFEAFRELLEGDTFVGLRLFAARDEQGVPQADCRVNGEDFEAGAQALRNYAASWPEAGYEFRKQYVILQSVEDST